MKSIIDIQAVLANAEELYASDHATEEMDGCTMQEAVYDALNNGLDEARRAYVELGKQVLELHEQTKDWTWEDEIAIERAWMDFRLADITHSRAERFDNGLADKTAAAGAAWRLLSERRKAATAAGRNRATRPRK